MTDERIMSGARPASPVRTRLSGKFTAPPRRSETLTT